jgi:pentatricopeptide repeat protein
MPAREGRGTCKTQQSCTKCNAGHQHASIPQLHPDQHPSAPPPPLVQVGRLWTSLADYYIRRGMFEKARDVYEEGLTSVITVRDFSLIFDALSQFEESLLAAKMEQLGDKEEEAMEEDGDEGADFLLKDDGDDLDLR